MEQFDTTQMANGGLALVLEPSSTWEDFPALSKKWISRLNAHVLSTPNISVDECLIEVEISGGKFWITYDDFQSGIQLEPKQPEFNGIVARLRDELLKEA
jgi:hypothetical protein